MSLLITNGTNTLVNSEVYDRDTHFKFQDEYITPEEPVEEGEEVKEVDEVLETSFILNSEYPPWYIEQLQKARNGELDSASQSPEPPDQPALEAPEAGKALQVLWEAEPGLPPGFHTPTPQNHRW